MITILGEGVRGDLDKVNWHIRESGFDAVMFCGQQVQRFTLPDGLLSRAIVRASHVL